jgi:hypothetical protein
MLGRALPERVDDRRIELHRWLATRLTGASEIELREQAGYTRVVSFETVHNDPQEIHKFAPVDTLADDECVIFDLSATTYGALRDPFLLQFAVLADSRAANSERTIVIMLGTVPPDNSAFWEPLHDLDRSRTGSIIVIDDHGTIQKYGPDRTDPDIATEYAKRQAQLRGTDAGLFRSMLLRRLGHFDLSRDGVELCGRYYYDASLCVSVLADILSHKLAENYPAAKRPEDAKIVLIPGDGPWMEDACRIAADRSGLDFIALPSDLPAVGPSDLSQTFNIVMADVVHTGSTLRKVLKSFDEWKVKPARKAITAVCTKQWVDELPSGVELDVIHRAPFEVIARRDCPQCFLNIPHCSPLLDETDRYLQITAYDFWDMALRTPWQEEPYAGQGVPHYAYDPDFARIFEDFGDWIAFRYELVLKHLGLDREVVVVCPDEPGILQLVSKLGARMNGLVSVAIPRSVLDDSLQYTQASWASPTSNGNEPAWRRQLKYLARTRPPVVFIDDFVSSGKTRADAARILRAHGIQFTAHVPFVARTEEAAAAPSGERTITFPLYYLASPRP